jgi:2-desacetyl-2-hydroxyethyl bacteriochlorophyllide A dehydrogenase
MKTLSCTSPGHFEMQSREKPVPREGYSILEIQRVGICGTDLHAFEGTQPYFSYPRILGHELAAIIEQTDDTGFKMGDAVTIIPYLHCGNCIACRNGKTNCCVNLTVCGVHIDGGMTEFLQVPTYSLLHADGLSFDELALVEPLAIGAHAARRAMLQKDEFVLVIGAGPIGLCVLEFCRIAGAKLIVMDVNKDRLNFCGNALKVEHLIDGKSPDVMEQLSRITGGDMPAAVFDVTGNLAAINKGFDYPAHGGRYVMVGLQKEFVSFSHPAFHKKEATLMSSRNATREDFEYVISCIKNKRIDPLEFITHRLTFGETRDRFESLLNPANKVIKAMISF